ncbi:MAG TPA: cell division protein FtsQ/DivIB [Novosphingobium sp.]|nr:cell division protein FtsQ/DivIB [Novosphingobium sp.]
MSQKLKRGGVTARRQAARSSSARKVEAARARTGSAIDTAMAMLPVSETQLHRFFLVLILVAMAVLLWVVASIAGVPAMAQAQVANIAAQAGFEVHKVVLRGAKHQNGQAIYDRVLGAQGNRAMPAVDLEDVRQDLLQLPWVEDARISRQLPDTLVVDIVERKAEAVLKVNDGDGSGERLWLMDATGHLLEPVAPDKVRGRLVMAGDGAEVQVAALAALFQAAPALRPQVAQAEWVGHRRWNLTFRTGQLLALPEGETESAHALQAFARLDGTNRLLGGQVAAFDMRTGDRMYLRVPGRADGDGAAGATRVAQAPSAGASTGASVAGTGVGVAAAAVAGAAVAGVVAHEVSKAKPAAKPEVTHEVSKHEPTHAAKGKATTAHADKHPAHADRPAEHKPAPKKADTHKSDAHKSEVHKAASRKPEAHKPAAHKPEAHRAGDHAAPHKAAAKKPDHHARKDN